MSLERFEGIWRSSEIHTNPIASVAGIPADWVDRKAYFPPPGMQLQGKVERGGGKIFRTAYLDPQEQQEPEALDILRFTVVAPASATKDQIARIESMEYHEAGGGLVVSNPVLTHTDTAFFEYMQLVESSTLPTGKPAGETRLVMRHWLVWTPSKGGVLRSMWPCCWLKAS